MPEQATPQLTRSIGLVQATAMVVGTIIGASIFVQQSEITSAVPSERGVIFVWAVAGVMTLFGSLIAAELSSAFPRTGGVYVFLKEAFSPALAFLWGWAMFWTMHTGIIAILGMVLARYVGHFVELSPLATTLVAVSAILVVTAVNYIGVRQGSAMQTVVTIGKVLAVATIIVVGFTFDPGARAPTQTAVAATALGVPSMRNFVVALIAGLFAFGGWHMVTYAAEETKEPEKTIPRALMIGTLVVTAAYIAMNAVYLHLLPIEAVIKSQRVAADAADVVLGSGGASIMAGLVIFSTFGALSGIVLSGPRVYLSMANDGLVPAWMGAVHPRFRTPNRAIALQGVWACVLLLTGTYRALFTRVVFTEWLFFALMAVGLVLLRKRAGYAPRYRVWGYPIVPIVFATASFAIVVNEIVYKPLTSLAGLGLVGIGYPVYLFIARRSVSRRS